MTSQGFAVVDDGKGGYRFQGELTVFQVVELQEFLRDRLTTGRDLDMSLADLTFIDIAALQMLIAFRHSSRNRLRFHISAISPDVERILLVTGLKTALLASTE